MPHTVAVYGASGHTGRFVARELELRGITVRRIVRRLPDELANEAGTKWKIASCDDPDALDEALEGVDAVINCAGPFLDTAPAIIELECSRTPFQLCWTISKPGLWVNETVSMSGGFAPAIGPMSPLYEKVDHELSMHFSHSRDCDARKKSQLLFVIPQNARL